MPVSSPGTSDETGMTGSVGPAVGAMTVLFALGRGKGASVLIPVLTPVLMGATRELDGAEPVGAMTVPLPIGYGAGMSVGTVGALLAGPETEVEDIDSAGTVTVEVIVLVISRVRVVVASGVGLGPWPPLG